MRLVTCSELDLSAERHFLDTIDIPVKNVVWLALHPTAREHFTLIRSALIVKGSSTVTTIANMIREVIAYPRGRG